MLIYFLIQAVVWAANPIGKVVDLQGTATVASQPLSVGSPVSAGDQVITGTGARVRILLDDEIAIQLGPDTTAKIERTKGMSRLGLIAGSVFSAIKPLAKHTSRYEVYTKTAVMGVRGTTFFVQEPQQKQKPTFVCVCNGTVDVKWKGRVCKITSKHHDAPKYLDPMSRVPTPAPLGVDHSDDDGAALQALLK